MPAVVTRARLVPLLLPLVLLVGCAATTTAVAKRQLDVQTKMTDTIFLEPALPPERAVYVEVKNSSDKPELDLARPVREEIAARGYRVVDDPRLARYLLQVNVLQAGRSSRSAAERSYEGGFGSAVTGGAIGAGAGYGIGRLGGNDTALAIGGALIGAAISTLADAFVQDTTYSVVADLQVSERAPDGVIVSESERANLAQGNSGSRSQTSSTTSGWKRYRTRVISTANRANLDWPDAAPSLAAGLTRTVAGIF